MGGERDETNEVGSCDSFVSETPPFLAFAPMMLVRSFDAWTQASESCCLARLQRLLLWLIRDEIPIQHQPYQLHRYFVGEGVT